MEVSGQLHVPAALTPGKESCYPLARRLGGPQSRSGRGGEEKNSKPPQESNPRTPIVQPVAQRYTDWAITALFHGTGYHLKSCSSLSLSKNILLSLWNPKVHHRVHKSLPLVPIPSQPNPIRPIDPCLSKVLFPLLRLCQRISPGPRRFETFRNNKNF
jgi:hypothetical protein